MSWSWRGRMGSSTGSTSATSTRRWTSAVDERSIPESSRSANLSSGLKSIQMATPQRQRAMSVSTCSRKATGGWGVQTEKIFWVSRMRSPQSRQIWRTRGKSSLGSWTISRTAAAAGSSLNRSQRVECPVCMEKVKPPMRLRLGTSSSVTLASIRTRETVVCAILAITGEDEYHIICSCPLISFLQEDPQNWRIFWGWPRIESLKCYQKNMFMLYLYNPSTPPSKRVSLALFNTFNKMLHVIWTLNTDFRFSSIIQVSIQVWPIIS